MLKFRVSQLVEKYESINHLTDQTLDTTHRTKPGLINGVPPYLVPQIQMMLTITQKQFMQC